MRRWGSVFAGLLVVVAGMAAHGGSSVTLPYRFSSGQVAVADHVNQDFDAVVAAIDAQGGRIAALEAGVFGLGTALHYQPLSAAPDELGVIAQRGYDSAVSLFNSGLADADEVCRWSKRLKDSDYLATFDEAERLAALDAHTDRMSALRDDAYLRFDVGLIPIVQVRSAEWCALEADTIARGYAVRAGL